MQPAEKEEQEAGRRSRTEDQQLTGERLVNDAIKRILLDIVLRGHGDRLIGRWSREPQLQEFLEQVPYLLDRINQLHLACMRVDKHEQHEHHYHHHRHRHPARPAEDSQQPSCGQTGNRSSLLDFIALIGEDRHWLVRTRDPLGLTPLHKAVLYNNQPVAEYILDRYSDGPAHPVGQVPAPRLVDAQDKYGRTALHYAAAQATIGRPARQLYQFLIEKGASLKVLDFRGKTPGHYVRQPDQLKVRCIVHLANKLNAQYQANLLTKTLRLAEPGRRLVAQTRSISCERLSTSPSRESMSVSCSDLARSELESDVQAGSAEYSANIWQLATDPKLSGLGSDSPPASNSSLDSSSVHEPDSSAALKRLVADRCQQPVIDGRTRDRIKRHLGEGSIERINELVTEGFGAQLIERARVDCWNQPCRRYINLTIPSLLVKLDALHECIASDQLLGLRTLLNEEPQLARIRRPYKRAHLNALHLAVRLNRRQIVKHLLERFPELVGQCDSLGATCLHWAARSRSTDTLYRWLDKHYGHQLGQVRDSRRKTAMDYRQQVIKMGSIEPGSTKGATNHARRNQFESLEAGQRVAANRLKLEGTKMNLGKRVQSTGKTAARPVKASQESVTERAVKDVAEQPIADTTLASLPKCDELRDLREPRLVSSAEPVSRPRLIEIRHASNSSLDRINPIKCETVKAPSIEAEAEAEPPQIQAPPDTSQEKPLERAPSLIESISEVELDPPSNRSVSSPINQTSSELKPDQQDNVFSEGEMQSDDDDDLSVQEDEDDDDESDDLLVERLSNEFEDRIRREKSELKAKVDQILNDIKTSTKSGPKSLRLPDSPSNRKDSPTEGDGQSSATMFVGIEAQNGEFATISSAANKMRQKVSEQSSRSSSGNSSAHTSAGSQGSTLGSTCSSSSSSSFSTSTVSDSPSCSISRSSSACSRASTTTRYSESCARSGQLESARPLPDATAQQKSLAVPALEGGAQLVNKNTYGQTYLHFIASRSQGASTLYRVLDHASHLIGERDIFYRTARDVAMQFNLIVNVRVIDKFIIDLFIDANTAVLRHLLNQGYTPLIHVADPEGNDIMLILKLLKLDRMIHFLLQMADFQRWRDELHTFIRNGYSAGVYELVRKHRDLVQARSIYSRTSLHLAVLFDRLEMVEELIKADPRCIDVVDNMGRTALHYSYGLHLRCTGEIRAKLLGAGARADLRDAKMRTPKYYYIFRREIEDIRHVELELN